MLWRQAEIVEEGTTAALLLTATIESVGSCLLCPPRKSTSLHVHHLLLIQTTSLSPQVSWKSL